MYSHHANPVGVSWNICDCFSSNVKDGSKAAFPVKFFPNLVLQSLKMLSISDFAIFVTWDVISSTTSLQMSLNNLLLIHQTLMLWVQLCHLSLSSIEAGSNPTKIFQVFCQSTFPKISKIQISWNCSGQQWEQQKIICHKCVSDSGSFFFNHEKHVLAGQVCSICP